MVHKAGFVNIIGNPNVGKSTLLNRLVGERLAIVTNKAQTTRQRLHGIINTDDYQIVFSDTPGILKPAYKLQDSMMRYVRTAFEDADILVYITDVVEDKTKNAEILQKIAKLDIKILALVNKIDLLSDEIQLQTHVNAIGEVFPNAEVLPISAANGANVDKVMQHILDNLPESPPYYDKDAISDKPYRFFAAEMVREKILLLYNQEIPYSTEVGIESYKESDDIDRIRAVIYVMRESQKKILIGHKGSSIKKLGIEARKEIEAFLRKKVFLELFVKVKKDWRNNEQMLKQFGY